MEKVDDDFYGWLSPTGEFYRCKYFEHAKIAKDLFNLTEEELERKGYIKIFPIYGSKEPYACYNRATLQQQEFLENNNIKVEFLPISIIDLARNLEGEKNEHL